MQISVENTSNLGRKIKIIIPAIKINEVVSSKIKKLTKQVKINGFRPGHVPEHIINKRYGDEARKEALSEIIDTSINKALTEYNLSPASELELENRQELENIKYDSNENIECIFSLEVYPEIKLNDFTGLQLKTLKVSITEKDIDDGILAVQEQFAKKVLVNRPAKKGDVLTVDFTGFIDGEKFPGGSSTDSVVEIGSEQFIDGFESGLIGSNPQDTIKLNLKFPATYAEKSLANKPVVFDIYVKKVEEKQYAALDENLAKLLGILDGNVEKIRPTIKTNLEKYADQLIKEKEHEQLSELLIKNYPIIELPSKLLRDEQITLEKSFKQNNQEQGVEIKELSDHTLIEIKNLAQKKVHLSLLLRKVINDNNLQVSEAIIQQKLNNFNYLFKKAVNNAYYQNMYNNIRNSIISSTLTNMALDFIMSKVIKIEDIITFEELQKN